MGTFSRNELNSYNFIRWRSASSVPFDEIGLATTAAGTNIDFPNQMLRDDRCYLPKMVLDSPISVYANLSTPASDADFANWVCVFADRYGNINNGHGTFTVTQDDFGGGNFRWYFSVTPGAANFIVDKEYRFVIYNASTENVKYVSNFMRAAPASDAYKYALLSYRSDSSLYNFNYTDLPSFRNVIFIDLNMVTPQPEITLTQYPQVTDGLVRNQKSYAKEVIEFESYQFDQGAHRAMLALSIHSDIKINTNQMEVKEAYEIIPSRKSSVSKGLIKMYNQSVSMINLNGYDS